MLKTAYIFLLGSLFLHLTTTGQIDHIHFTTITSRDGLVSNSVNAIFQDRQGLMWQGVTTPNYFAQSFKSKFNMLPLEYIAKNSKKKADN